MKPTRKPRAVPGKSLEKVLDQSTHVEGLVEEAASELSAVNETLKQEVAEAKPPPALEGALDKSEAAEAKVLDASEKLGVVNEALKAEVSDRLELEQELAEVAKQGDLDRHAALHDPLTELPNRVLFLDRLEQALAQARRQQWSIAVMFADLDGFKAINDTHGHEAGDAVLRTVGSRLKEACRADDTVSRHGGDEFLCLQLDVGDDRSLEIVVRKLIDHIEAPIAFSALSHVVRVSVGIAVFPRDGANATELISSADKAMYVAKKQKCGFVFSGSEAPGR